jgi:DNA invertase Pin-like site-specific DNA recombinase
VKYGYERVSTNDQNPEAQRAKLVAAGCDKIFTDKGQSGAKARRPEWDNLLAVLGAGDQLVCVKLDRIGRSVRNLIDVTDYLQAVGVDLVVIDQAIDTSTPTGALLFHVLAAIAEFERGLIIERTHDGQAAVRRDGNLRRSLGGSAPLGFLDLGGADDRDWTLDEVTGAWLREAAQLVLDDPDHNIDAAFRALDPITHADREVTAKQLRAALQRPASAGLIQLDGQLVGTAAIGGPLDEPTYARLAVVFGSRKRGRPTDRDAYPFGPVLRCAKCQNQLTGEKVRTRRGQPPVPYYACRNPHKRLPWGGSQLTPCHGVSVPAADVHTLIDDAMQLWALTPAARAAAARQPATATRRAEVETDLADLAEQLAEIDAKRFRLRNQPAARTRYDALAVEAEQLITTAEAELAALDEVDAAPGVPAALDWAAMTSAEKRATLAEAYQTPIDVQPGNGGGAALSAADRIDLYPRAA